MESLEAFCPYCGEPVDLLIDAGGSDAQEYVEDCPICCRPWDVALFRDEDGGWKVSLRTADE